MVGRDGEGLQHFEVDLVVAVGVEQVRRDVAEAQALFDQALGRAETRRDGTHGEAGVGQLRERDHLIGGMHGDADDILRQRQLARHRRIGGDQAGHWVVGVDRAVLGQGLHGREAASAGDHGIGAGIGRSVHANDQVLQQAMGGDGGLHLGLGDRIGRRLAHVLGRKRQAGERNLPDERFVQGGDVIHANLPRYRDEKDGMGAAETALSGRPAPRPAPAPLRLLAGAVAGHGRRWRNGGGRPRRRQRGSGRGWERSPGPDASSRASALSAALSAARSRTSAALRSAAAASRLLRVLTGISGDRSGSAVHDIQKVSLARASSACLSASAGARWIARVTTRPARPGRCARPTARGSSRRAAGRSCTK